ncbi:MAG: twin-arginine translocase TatA/TatE family subunit [Nitrososphaeria archaeon]|nr:twin-arginine translocase TatA/TatE family subunit [Nitrososphaeria archaeon]
MLEKFVFNIVGMEWFWVLIVVVVLLFGASKIPEIARAIGRATGEFQKGKLEIEREIEKASAELNKSPERLKLEEAAKALGIDPTGKTDEQLREEIKKAA